jgi:hypothetical protein
VALALPTLNPDFLYAALDATSYAAFVKESRKNRAGATKLLRKSGERVMPRRGSFTERHSAPPPHKCEAPTVGG